MTAIPLILFFTLSGPAAGPTPGASSEAGFSAWVRPASSGHRLSARRRAVRPPAPPAAALRAIRASA